MPLATKLSIACRIFNPFYVRNINRAILNAMRLQQQGHIKEARELMETLLRNNPESKAVRHHYAVLAEIEGSDSHKISCPEKKESHEHQLK